MKLSIIKSALIYCLANTDDYFGPREKNELLQAYAETIATSERLDFDDDYHNDVSLLPDPACTDILNCMTYDILGKRLRKHGDNMRFEYYAHDVREQMCTGLNMLTNAQLQLGYEVISDLWHTNEETESNAADGTFLNVPKITSLCKADGVALLAAYIMRELQIEDEETTYDATYSIMDDLDCTIHAWYNNRMRSDV